MTVKTNNFTFDLLENYMESNLKSNSFWLFGSDSTTTIDDFSRSANSQKSIASVLDKTIFGIKLVDAHFAYLVPNNFWQSGRVYSKYDDNVDLNAVEFYVTVRPEIEGGNYEVFKCLSNADGAPSTVRPLVNGAVNLLDGIYNLEDGYTWKYMCTIPSATYNKFSGRGLAPVSDLPSVQSLAVDGINFIHVENRDTNSGYRRFTGRIFSTVIQDLEYRIDLEDEDVFSEVANYYTNMSLYVQKSDGGARTYKITASSFVSGNRISLSLEGISPGDVFKPSVNDYIEILPTIEIKGTGTGATGIPVFDSTNQRIVGVRMLTIGSGYKDAVAEVIDPNFFSETNPNRSDVKCILRPIIPPPGGHGSNVARELNCKAIGISTTVTSIAPSLVPSTNTYTRAILVKNPTFTEAIADNSFDNRLKMTLSAAPPSYVQVGTVVSQVVNGETISATVHEIQGSILYLVEYTNPSTQTFTASLPLIVGDNPNLSINSIETSKYVQRTGQSLYITEFLPVDRTPDRSEQIKIIVDF